MGRCVHFTLKHFWKRCAASILLVCAVYPAVLAGGLVSVDRCADQYVLALMDRADIRAVSFEADHQRSFYQSRAVGLPTVDGTLEEVLTLKPDTVVLTYRGGPRAAEILTSLGVKAVRPPYAFTIEDNFGVLRTMGTELGAEARAEALVADYESRLQALKDAEKYPAKALYMTPGGFTAGLGTGIDDIIKLAGFDTVAAGAGINGWVPLPLEAMVLNPPDFIVATFFEDADIHVSHWSSSRHGVYQQLMGDLPTIHVPSRFLTCAGVYAVDAADYIRQAALAFGLGGGSDD